MGKLSTRYAAPIPAVSDRGANNKNTIHHPIFILHNQGQYNMYNSLFAFGSKLTTRFAPLLPAVSFNPD